MVGLSHQLLQVVVVEPVLLAITQAEMLVALVELA
jgi:hypothetical protein